MEKSRCQVEAGQTAAGSMQRWMCSWSGSASSRRSRGMPAWEEASRKSRECGNFHSDSRGDARDGRAAVGRLPAGVG